MDKQEFNIMETYYFFYHVVLKYSHAKLNEKLTKLSASSKANWKNLKHLTILGICFGLILFKLALIYNLLTKYHSSAWLLILCVLFAELVFKMINSIILYSLVVFDLKRTALECELIFKDPSNYNVSKENQTNDDKLKAQTDQSTNDLNIYVYYIKDFGQIINILVALYLTLSGVYIYLFDSYKASLILFMCINRYLRIWMHAKESFSAFMKRRHAFSKLKQLPILELSTFKQIKLAKTNLTDQTCEKTQEKFNSDSNKIIDLIEENCDKHEEEEFFKKIHEACAICYCELCAYEARITMCNHFFHSSCLKNWLNFQDTCPMCHQIVFSNSAMNLKLKSS